MARGAACSRIVRQPRLCFIGWRLISAIAVFLPRRHSAFLCDVCCVELERDRMCGSCGFVFAACDRISCQDEVFFGHSQVCSHAFVKGMCRQCTEWYPRRLRKCRGCKIARFCSRACQKKAWTLWHRSKCGWTDIVRA